MRWAGRMVGARMAAVARARWEKRAVQKHMRVQLVAACALQETSIYFQNTHLHMYVCAMPNASPLCRSYGGGAAILCAQANAARGVTR
jgi:hypothetical protein